MMKSIFKELFAEIFTVLAWVTLLGFVFYCTFTGNKTDSVRDAWNILILIAGFVWGNMHKKNGSGVNIPSDTFDIKGTIDTTKKSNDENN